MKNLPILAWILMLAACGKGSPPPAPAPAPAPAPRSSATKPPPPPGPAPTARAPRVRPPDPVSPHLSIIVNDSDTVEVPAGWPIIVQVDLSAPVGRSIPLGSAVTAWGSLVRLETPAGWEALRPAYMTKGQITLDAATTGRLVWTARAEDAAKLPRGDVELAAVLDASGAGDSWKGVVRARARVRLSAAPPQLSLKQDLDRTRRVVREALWRGDGAAGIALVEKAIAIYPNTPSLIAVKAEAFEVLGRFKEALDTYALALDTSRRRNSSPHFYLHFVARQHAELAARLRAADTK